MNRPAAIGLRLVLVACAVGLWLSATPGGLEPWLLPVILAGFLAVPVFLVALPFLAVLAMRRVTRFRAEKKAPKPLADPTGDAVGPLGGPDGAWRRSAAFATVAVLLTIVLIATNVPMRLAFAASRSAFEAELKNAPWNSLEVNGHHPLERRLGLLYVDRWVNDERGGVFFRTGTSRDVIDTVSHGFVHRPNREGTPFGRAHYRVHHLTGDWYVFSVSNDY